MEPVSITGAMFAHRRDSHGACQAPRADHLIMALAAVLPLAEARAIDLARQAHGRYDAFEVRARAAVEFAVAVAHGADAGTVTDRLCRYRSACRGVVDLGRAAVPSRHRLEG